jgi:uncharacterized membrane protein
MEKKVIDEGKGLAWLSYLGILLLIPLLVNKDNEYSKFHVKQGIVLLIAGIALSIASIILGFIPVIGALIALAVGIFLLVLTIMGIVNALTEKTTPLPVIGKYAEKIKI